jgi:hypothetical protein
MDVASFLKEICEILSRCHTTSRELDALEFEADGRDVCIRVRRELHGSSYPPLTVILARIGRTCLEHGIAVPQLSRIAFLSDEVRVELGGTGQPPAKVYRYPIEATLGAPAREATLTLVKGGGGGGSED